MVSWLTHLSTAQTNWCESDLVQLRIQHEGVMDAGNVTYILLSDELGSFNQPDTLATVHSDTSFMYSVPNLTGSSGYLLKAVTTAPFTEGDLSSLNISIEPVPSAVVSPTGPIEFCYGESATLSASQSSGYQYQWFNTGSFLSGETNAHLTVTTDGKFGVIISNQCGTDTSTQVTVTVHPLPQVSFDTAFTVCHNQSPLTLTGGQPAGGDYSGNGVNNNNFSAIAAGTGTHDLRYIFIDNNGCADTAWSQILVEVCGGVNHSLNSEYGTFYIFPNPTKDLLTISWNGSKKATLKIWSTDGRLMQPSIPITDYRKLNTTHWSSGVYYVEVETEDGERLRERVVVCP